MINLPKSCLVDKFLAKKLFYEKANASQSVKKQFIDNVDKITWMYKISQDTININKTEDVEEIQVFELLLKQKCDLKEIINVLTKKIPYPILFHIKYDEEFQYAIKYNDKICYSEWNKDIDFNFSGLNLNLVYKDIVRKINNIDELNDIAQTTLYIQMGFVENYCDKRVINVLIGEIKDKVESLSDIKVKKVK